MISTVAWKVCTASAYLAIKPDLLHVMDGCQFGVAVPNGTSLMLAQLETAQLGSSEAGIVYARLDVSNAFGSVSRRLVRDSILDACPAARETWGPWLTHMLATPSLVPNTDSELTMHIFEGLPQGNPLSAFLFSVFVSLQLKQAVAKCDGSISATAYVDDMVLYGTPEAMEACILPCLAFLDASSLPPNPSKTQVWCSGTAPLHDFPVLSSMSIEEEGLVICGHTLSSSPDETDVPLGNANFVHDWCSQKLAVERVECRKLLQLQDQGRASHAFQTAFMLFRLLYPSRLLHLFRALPAGLGRSLAEGMMEHVNDFMCHTLSVPRLSRWQRDVMCLPISKGGLGVSDLLLEATICRVASLASMSQMESAPPIVQTWLDSERAELFGRMDPSINDQADSLLGDLCHLDVYTAFLTSALVTS